MTYHKLLKQAEHKVERGKLSQLRSFIPANIKGEDAIFQLHPDPVDDPDQDTPGRERHRDVAKDQLVRRHLVGIRGVKGYCQCQLGHALADLGPNSTEKKLA